MAQSVLAVLPLIILFFVAQRYYIQGVVISGVKG
jgi:multiple sugar transport system permease protein